MNILDQSLGSLARDIPGATAVLHEYRLDFCWNGDQILRQAASSRGLDLAEVVASLEAVRGGVNDFRDWRQAASAELIDHILIRFHERHREQLPVLIRLAHRVEQAHAAHPDCPAGLTDHLIAIQQELESHMLKEERVLFPILSQGIYGPATAPISVMRHEHDQHGKAVARLGQLTHDMDVPEGACNTWRSLYQDLITFRRDLMDHIHLENRILFEGLSAPAAESAHG